MKTIAHRSKSVFPLYKCIFYSFWRTSKTWIAANQNKAYLRYIFFWQFFHLVCSIDVYLDSLRRKTASIHFLKLDRLYLTDSELETFETSIKELPLKAVKIYNFAYFHLTKTSFSYLSLAEILILQQHRSQNCNYSMAHISHSEVFLGKGTLKICSKFTGENTCRSVISKKVAKQLYWNRTLAKVFCCKFATYFQDNLFLSTNLEGCFR